MNSIQIIYLALIFITVFVVALVILTQFNTKTLQDRLRIVRSGRDEHIEIDEQVKVSPWVGKIIADDFLGPTGSYRLNQKCGISM